MAIADVSAGTGVVAQTGLVNHWIDGAQVASKSGRSGDVFNPATGEVRSRIGFADACEVDTAVASSLRAFPEWRATALSRRAEILFKLRELLDANRRKLAELITLEHGKTVADAMGEVARGLENIEFACGIPNLLKGGFSEQASRGIDVYQIRQPLGVVCGITPFNFPAMVPMWMFANAIACGNTFILKPSEKDPSVSLLIAELWRQAGLPDGVFNVLQGDRAAVDRLLEHPDVKAVSFVGSTPVAKSIYETATRNGKRVQALGGAKNHMLVLPDADIDMAADAAISAGYGSAGERCMSISVVVAVGDVAEPLIEAIRERIPKIRIGPGIDEAYEMGPLVTREHRDRVASYVAGAKAEGAEVAVDGRDDAVSKSKGFFLGASLLDRVKPGMRCYDDEIFGPVLGVARAATYAEALELINKNPFGNGVAIFTRDGGAARQFQFDVDAGMVGINVPVPVPVAYYSFGGWKASLFGDLHMYGPEGVQFYTRAKVVTSRWPDPGDEQDRSGISAIALTETMKSVEELFSLRGRVAIVTGASRGLGKEAAEALAEAGANVVLAARRAQWLEPTAKEFEGRGFEVLSCTCDIADETQVKSVAAQALERFGRIDILINNAGVSWAAPFEEATIESWNRVLATNVLGTELMTRAVLPAMREQGYGKIVNVASVMGLVGVPKDILEASSYTASKGAIIALTRELAVNYAAQGIRANAIAPGFFPTRLASAVIDRAGGRIAELTPLGRVGEEGELKGAILFLSAPASDYITGQVLAIDGGMTAA